MKKKLPSKITNKQNDVAWNPRANWSSVLANQGAHFAKAMLKVNYSHGLHGKKSFLFELLLEMLLLLGR